MRCVPLPWPLSLLLALTACGSSSPSPPAQAPGNGDGGDDGAIAPPGGDAGAPSDASSGDGASTTDGGARDGLVVSGNTLTSNGKTVRLLGTSHSGTEYTCIGGNGIFEGPTDDTLPAAMLTWHINAVRIPLNEDCWLGVNGVDARYSGAAYQTALVTYVGMLRKHGLFVVLDLHWNAPGANQSKHQEPMADLDHAPDFWKSVATAFKSDRGVVFDLYNEPYVSTSNAQTSDAWDCWLNGCTITQSDGFTGNWKSAGMQALVDAVRSTGATNVILAGGLAYANDLSGWLTHQPNDPLKQLAASFHLYSFNTCKDPTCWAAQVEPVSKKVPLVTGELGEDDCLHGFIDGYMAWADARGISYLGWTWNAWDCRSGPALVTDYAGTPTPFGAGLRAHLLSIN